MLCCQAAAAGKNDADQRLTLKLAELSEKEQASTLLRLNDDESPEAAFAFDSG